MSWEGDKFSNFGIDTISRIHFKYVFALPPASNVQLFNTLYCCVIVGVFPHPRICFTVDFEHIPPNNASRCSQKLVNQYLLVYTSHVT